MPVRILIVWDRMGDYHRARVNCFKKLHKDYDIYTADLGGSDQLYKWESSINDTHELLSDKPSNVKDISTRFQNFKSLLQKHQINKVILSGYGKPEYLLFTVWLKLKNIDCYYFAESWYKGNRFVDIFKGLFVKWFTKGLFVSGERAKKHFEKTFSYDPKKIVTGYSVVDNQHFATTVVSEHIVQKVAKNPILLCVARHAEEKNLARLINAFQQSTLFGSWILKVVGGGPLNHELKKLLPNDHSILLQDWVSYNKLPELYASASCFILPSIFEPWGLVVNEAMAAGLPIIISNQCGCKPDLLKDNGWSFDAHNQEQLVQTLNLLDAASPEELRDKGNHSKDIIKSYSTHTWANKLYKLIQNS